MSSCLSLLNTVIHKKNYFLNVKKRKSENDQI